MAYCEKCGAVLDSSLVRCPLCGTKVYRPGNEAGAADDNKTADPYAGGYRRDKYDRSSQASKTGKEPELKSSPYGDVLADEGGKDGAPDSYDGADEPAGDNDSDTGYSDAPNEMNDLNNYAYPSFYYERLQDELELFRSRDQLAADPELSEHQSRLSVLNVILGIDVLFLIFFLPLFLGFHIIAVIWGVYVSYGIRKTAEKYGLGWWLGGSHYLSQACFMIITGAIMIKCVIFEHALSHENGYGVLFTMTIVANLVFMPALALSSGAWAFKIRDEIKKLTEGSYGNQELTPKKSVFSIGVRELVIFLVIIVLMCFGNYLVCHYGLHW